MTLDSNGLQISTHGDTDVGQVREGNEDNLYVGQTVFAVADGMGGHLAGEVASETALEPLREIDGREFTTPDEANQALVEAIREANVTVVAKAASDPKFRGMGTTLTAVLIRDGRLHIAHVGDSRAYLLREGQPIHQLTTDHTLVEQLIQEGRITRDQASSHPQRSVITRAIGVERNVLVDALPAIELEPGDQLLLCSDGLTGPVNDAEITEILRSVPDGDAACQALVDAANAAGGPDNITVVLLRVQGERSAAVATPAAAHHSEEDTTEDLGGPPPPMPNDEDATEDLGPPPPPHASEEDTTEDLGTPPPRPVNDITAVVDPATVAAAKATATEEAPEQEAVPIRTRADTPEHWDAQKMGKLGAPSSDDRGAKSLPAKRRGRRWVAIVVAIVVLLGVVAGGGYLLLSRAYFVGAHEGNVAIFNGLPQEVAGLRLHWVLADEVSDVPVAALPDHRRQAVEEGIPAGTLLEARRIVSAQQEALETGAETSAEGGQEPGAEADPDTSPSP